MFSYLSVQNPPLNPRRREQDVSFYYLNLFSVKLHLLEFSPGKDQRHDERWPVLS